MSTNDIIKKFSEFNGSWDDFIDELSNDHNYADALNDIRSRKRLAEIKETLPASTHCWKLIKSWTFLYDLPMDESVSWFMLKIEPLFIQLNTPTQIKFTCSNDIYFACLLQKDNLLPSELSIALAETLLNTMSEIKDKKYTIDSLFMTPGKRGRQKGSGVNEDYVMLQYFKLSQQQDKGTVYSSIADKLNVSKVTIRRIVERQIELKESKENLIKWLKNKCKTLAEIGAGEEKEKQKMRIINELSQIEKNGKSSKYYIGLKSQLIFFKKLRNNQDDNEIYAELIETQLQRLIPFKM